MPIDHTYKEFIEGIKTPIRFIKKPIRFIDDNQLHVGEKHITNFEKEEAVIIEFRRFTDIDIQFQDQYGYIKNTTYQALTEGNCKNPYHPNQYGGCFGVGPYDGTTTKNMKKAKTAWYHLLERTNEEFRNKMNDSSKYNSYENCSLYPDWYNYQNFARWYISYIYKLNPNVQYEIDKDILQWGQEYKIYGPYTCALVPHMINQAFVGLDRDRIKHDLPTGITKINNRYVVRLRKNGNKSIHIGSFKTIEEAVEVYKKAKKEYIVELAEYYYSIGALYPEIYQALLNLEL